MSTNQPLTDDARIPEDPDRDESDVWRRGEEDSDLDGREAASLLYGGPDHSNNSTNTDTDTTDNPTDAPSE